MAPPLDEEKHWVATEEIENRLQTIWESLACENKVRACLFNLVVYTKCDQRSEHLSEVVRKVVENYPCRVIFLWEDLDTMRSYLKAAVSVLDLKNGSDTACDRLDIVFTKDHTNHVFPLLLPHIVPDLPLNVLWLDTPSSEIPFFLPLESLCERVIVDSGSASTLERFLRDLSLYLPRKKAHISDVNWTRIAPWRELIEAEFSSLQARQLLQKADRIEVTYNGEKNSYIPHPETETLYWIFWLAALFGWTFQKQTGDLLTFSSLTVALLETQGQGIRPGAILSIKITAQDTLYSLERALHKQEEIVVKRISKAKCDLPRKLFLHQSARGASLSAEMVKKQTNPQYLATMESLQSLWHGKKSTQNR
ncbi:MAG: glucose-6-phosphate dehydrogenase assembly protein OpcA [Chlamydiota bacterium]